MTRASCSVRATAYLSKSRRRFFKTNVVKSYYMNFNSWCPQVTTTARKFFIKAIMDEVALVELQNQKIIMQRPLFSICYFVNHTLKTDPNHSGLNHCCQSEPNRTKPNQTVLNQINLIELSRANDCLYSIWIPFALARNNVF